MAAAYMWNTKMIGKNLKVQFLERILMLLFSFRMASFRMASLMVWFGLVFK